MVWPPDPLAQLVARVKLQRIRRVPGFVCKRRFAHAPLLVTGGNLLLAALGIPVRLTSEREWHRREQQMPGRVVRVDEAGWLWVPWAPGEDVRTLLRRDERAGVRAVAAATRALAELHAAGFTHADATVGNVAWDAEEDRARFFDFEMHHLESLPFDQARADDLRALFFSAAAALRPPARGQGFATALAEYSDKGPLRVLARWLEDGVSQSGLIHRGQAPMSRAEHRALATTFLEALPQSG